MHSYPLSSLSRSTLPSSPGVYLFKDQKDVIIYVGKAKNLSHRVSSYFRSPVLLGEKTSQMVEKARSLSYIEVGSELEALLLEARLINKIKPFYNLISKDDKSPYYIHISQDRFPKPIINHEPFGALAGPFLNSFIPRRILKSFRKIAPYCTAPKSQKNPCLYSHLGLCNPCPHQTNFTVDQLKQYKNNIRKLKLLLAGKFKQIKKDLKTEMHNYSQEQLYESALIARDQLLYLDTLLQKPVLPEEYLQNPNLEIDKRHQGLNALQQALNQYFTDLDLTRIETYDIANLQGKNATAAMTVAHNGYVDSKYYRHFRIKTVQSSNDPAMLSEVLTRRLARSDWPQPGLIVLDGGIPQLSIVLQNISLPVTIISLAKRLETIIIPYQENFVELNLPKDNPGLQLLQHLRDEAHRFSRRLHHKYRDAILK